MVLARMLAAVFVFVSLSIGDQTGQKPATPAPPAQQQPQPPKKKESVIAWLLRFAGITQTSSKQKGDEKNEAGTIWIADLVSGEARALPYGANFRWPIFLADRSVLALKGEEVVKLSLTGNDQQSVTKMPCIAKLVGNSLDNPDEVLVVVGEGKSQRLATLSISSGQISTPEFETKQVPGVPDLTEEKLALDIAMSSERESGNLKVYVETMRDQDKPQPWTDVLLLIKKSGPIGDPTNVSNCNGAKCSQPSLSMEGRYVAYIKAPRI